MGAVEILLLVLIAAVLVFGIGVVVLNRRRADGGAAPDAPPTRPAAPPPKPGDVKAGSILEQRGDTAVLDHPEPEVEPEPEPATLRERLAKARSTFAGAIAGVLGRTGITEESFDDLEEALNEFNELINRRNWHQSVTTISLTDTEKNKCLAGLTDQAFSARDTRLMASSMMSSWPSVPSMISTL